MQVSVETLDGLERKLTVAIPADKLEEQVSTRLKKVARTAKIDGFRPGKAPLSVIKKNYLNSVHAEVANDLIRSTLPEAINSKKLHPAGMPDVEPQPIEAGKDFTYFATLEVYPEIKITELDKEEVEIIKSEVEDKDVDKMIEKLLEQHKNWTPVTRKVADGDQIIFDFEGFIDGVAFEGGKAENHELIIGEGKMIPGFEAGIVGAEIGKLIDVEVTFPEDYGDEKLRGKAAIFKITVKEVKEGQTAELNDEFVKEKFNIKKGGVAAFKKDIKANMNRQLEQEVNSKNRNTVFNKLLEKNSFDLPKVLVDKEIDRMAHELYHRVFGNEHHDNEKIPDFPRELFQEEANRRVQLGLLFAEYVESNEIVADKERVDAMIEKFAESYESPDELRTAYRGSKERMAEVESLVVEDMVCERLREKAKIVEKKMDYDAVVNPPKETEEKGA